MAVIIGGVKRRRGILLAVVGAGLLAVLIAVLWPGEKEPEYQGKKLRDWLWTYMNHTKTDPAAQEATNAIHHIGTNALPFLVRWTDYKPSPWRQKWATIVMGIPLPFPRSYVVAHILGQGEFLITISTAGFRILREEAAPAVPALTRLLNDWNAEKRTDCASMALILVGKDGLPPLVAVVTNKAVPVPNRRWTAELMTSPFANFGTNALWAVPILLPCLKDAPVSDCVGELLAKWRLAPDQVVPALARCLRSPDHYVRAGAARALGEFGSEASSAAPDLLAATADIDPAVRGAATNALQIISPEVLKKDAH